VPGTVDGGGGPLHLHSKVLYSHAVNHSRASAFGHLSPMPEYSIRSGLGPLLIPDWFRHRYFFFRRPNTGGSGRIPGGPGRMPEGPVECRRVRPNTGVSDRMPEGPSECRRVWHSGIKKNCTKRSTFAAQHDLKGTTY
jgi:hypothetical protein